MSDRRVVVTGLGMVTPLGLNVDETWSGILAGKSGVSLIDAFDTSSLTTKISASVRGFDSTPYLTAKEKKRFAQFVQYAVASASQAIDDAGLSAHPDDADRIGVAIGAGMGGLSVIENNLLTIQKYGPRRISPFFIPSAIINMAPGLVSIKYGYKGPNISLVSACTTGSHNIGYAMRTIMHGDADVMLAGGTEMATTVSSIGGFASAKALSKRNDDPERASRPWDVERDGFVLGDGAGVMVLEEYEYAKRRGATIYAELAGFGMSADAYHVTSPGEDGTTLCMRNTLNDGKINPDQVNYINAHGTSTPIGDRAEIQAIKKAFGDSAGNVAISSTKSMTGHLLGAAGAIEAIFCVKAIQDQIAPATMNLFQPDEGCDLDLIANTPREMPIEYALSNSFGFGGTNGSLLFKQFNA